MIFELTQDEVYNLITVEHLHNKLHSWYKKFKKKVGSKKHKEEEKYLTVSGLIRVLSPMFFIRKLGS